MQFFERLVEGFPFCGCVLQRFPEALHNRFRVRARLLHLAHQLGRLAGGQSKLLEGGTVLDQAGQQGVHACTGVLSNAVQLIQESAGILGTQAKRAQSFLRLVDRIRHVHVVQFGELDELAGKVFQLLPCELKTSIYFTDCGSCRLEVCWNLFRQVLGRVLHIFERFPACAGLFCHNVHAGVDFFERRNGSSRPGHDRPGDSLRHAVADRRHLPADFLKLVTDIVESNGRPVGLGIFLLQVLKLALGFLDFPLKGTPLFGTFLGLQRFLVKLFLRNLEGFQLFFRVFDLRTQELVLLSKKSGVGRVIFELPVDLGQLFGCGGRRLVDIFKGLF